ncbi:MAG TPA: PAS domain S-box protein [Gemmatimonas sp.]|uniref:sensor domain-containing diguanylate cyclase n=1 Tax=Gemmatimonas sp. TaxID=1962908 RepID=UPI002EDAD3C5
MPATTSPFRQFTRLAAACMVAFVALCGIEWLWVRAVTKQITAVPARTALIARDRMLSQRFIFGTIASIQAPSAEARGPWFAEREWSRTAIEESLAKLHDISAHTAEGSTTVRPTLAAELLRMDTTALSLLSTGDDLVTDRLDGTRGPLSESEIASLVLRLNQFIGMVDTIVANEVTWTEQRTRALQRDQSIVFGGIVLVVLLLVLVVLRPAAMRMGAMAKSIAQSNTQLAEQAAALEDATHELESQNLELQAQQNSMEQHRQLLESVQIALGRNEERYRAIFTTMAEGLVLRDDRGQLQAWNPSAARIAGVPESEFAQVVGAQSVFELLDDQGLPLAEELYPFNEVLRTGKPQLDRVVSVRRRDGAIRWLRFNLRLVQSEQFDLDGRRGVVGSFVDITEERATAERLRSFSVVLEQTDQPIAMTDAQLRLTWVNRAWTEATGYSLDEAIGKRPGELLHGTHTAADTVERMRAAARQGEPFSGEVLNYRRDGTPFWMEVHTTPLRDERGVIESWISVERDITSRKTEERERQQLAAALAVTTDGIGIVSVGGGLEFVNHAYARVHRDRPRNLIGRPWTSRFPSEEALRIERDIIPLVTRLGAWSGEVIGMRANGDIFPQELSITLLPTGGLVCVMRDATDRKSAEEMLRTQAMNDELTGLFNRRGFFAMANSRLEDARRRKAPALMLYGDADYFKQVNDTYGHEVGDRVLQTIASVLRSCFRSSDIVARLGGDEYVALLLDTPADTIDTLREKIEVALHEVNALGVCPCPIGMSFGYAAFDPDQATTLDELLRSADETLYEVKRTRRAARAAA